MIGLQVGLCVSAGALYWQGTGIAVTGDVS